MLDEAFSDDVNKLKTIMKNLEMSLDNRKEQIAAGKSTSQIDAKIGSYMSSINSAMRNVEDAYKRLDLTKNEEDKNQKVDIMNSLKTWQSQMQVAVSKILFYKQRDLYAEESKNVAKGEDGEYDNTRNLTNKQLNDQNQDMLRDQEEKSKALLGHIEVITEGQKNIKVALHKDKQIITQLDNKVEENTGDLIMLDNKVKKIIATTGNCCLWLWIIIEIVAGVVVLVVPF